ncbi:hypothetical protein [uncultured Chryseobacterium sp.]|uniref:hypothetical protein n=1 Tax=uncultured Chryseobacterium sp. TaxID=259322 RepID=UPI0025DA1CD4|nr:hypothetical protein [uncultured Chryseobacterium sp.]
MYQITERIIVGKKATLEKDSFINEEIGSSAAIKFVCCQCGHLNSVKIIPYESGFPAFQLYDQDKVLSKNELLKNKMTENTSSYMLHLGEVTVDDMPALYFGIGCSTCIAKYIGIFGYAEKQPGLEMLKVSGIWNYTTG